MTVFAVDFLRVAAFFTVLVFVSRLGEGFAVGFTGFFSVAADAGFSLTTGVCAGLDGGICVFTVAVFFSLAFALFFNSFAGVFFSIMQPLCPMRCIITYSPGYGFSGGAGEVIRPFGKDQLTLFLKTVLFNIKCCDEFSFLSHFSCCFSSSHKEGYGNEYHGFSPCTHMGVLARPPC